MNHKTKKYHPDNFNFQIRQRRMFNFDHILLFCFESDDFPLFQCIIICSQHPKRKIVCIYFQRAEKKNRIEKKITKNEKKIIFSLSII